MNRIQRFAHNAGTIATIQTVIVLAIIFLGLTKDFQTGLWVFTLPAIVGVFLLVYLIRGFLVEFMPIVRWVMNILLAIALILIFGVGIGSGSNAGALEQVLVVSAMSLYMSCFFWMYSDPSVSRVG